MHTVGMQATRAYIASAGTAVVMLGASLCMFVVVSTFVAFGSWPGAQSHASVDQVLLRDVASPRPKTVAVRADAVAIARRAAAAARDTTRRKAGTRVAPRTSPVAQVPGRTTSPATATAPSAAAPAPAGAPKQAPVQQQADNVAGNVDTTTRNVVTQVTEQAQTVQTQVNEVVGQVVGSPPPPVTTNPVDSVKNAAGSLLGG
jgi:hypothetical protein